MIKVAAPAAAQYVVEAAIQAFGGAGVTNDHFLATAYATTRLLRLADGPDEVHRNTIGKLELARHRDRPAGETGALWEPLTIQEATAMNADGAWPAP